MASREVAFDIAPSHFGAQPHTVLTEADRSEILEMLEIDQELRRGQAKCEHRHQALTTGNHLGVSVAGSEQTDGLRNRRGRGVFKNRRLHPVSHQYVIHRLTVFITGPNNSRDSPLDEIGPNQALNHRSTT